MAILVEYIFKSIPKEDIFGKDRVQLFKREEKGVIVMNDQLFLFVGKASGLKVYYTNYFDDYDISLAFY